MNNKIFLIVQAILDPLWKACEILCEFGDSPNKEKFEKIRNMGIDDDIRYVYERGCYDWFLTFHAAKELYDFCRKQRDVPGAPKYTLAAEWLKPICETLLHKEHPVHKSDNKVFVSTKDLIRHAEIAAAIREEYNLPEDWCFSGPITYKFTYDSDPGLTKVIVTETHYVQGYEEIIDESEYYAVKASDVVYLLSVESYEYSTFDVFTQFDHISRTVKY